MMNELNRDSLLRTCRLCLENISPTSTLLPIYENGNLSGRYFNGFNESIPDIILSCVGIEIDPKDRLPTVLCSSCEKSLISSNNFRLKCLQANKWLVQFKVKAEEVDDNESEDDTTCHSNTEPEVFVVNTVKEEACEDISDHENESTSSMNDSVFNSSQCQRNSASSQRVTVSRTRNNFNISDVENAQASKMCVICGLIVKRLHEHSNTNMRRNERIQHINIPGTTDRQNSPPATTEESYDFLMCRMFHKNVRQYVKVKFLSSVGLHFNDFLRAATETFNFNISSLDHFVDQEGYRIESQDFINVITSDAGRNNFAVGVILRKDDETNTRPPADNANQTIFAPQPNVCTPFGTTSTTTVAESVFTPLPSHVCTTVGTTSPVTASDLQAYLIKRKGSYILQEYKEKSMLSDKSRRFLINAAVNFLEENFGIYPKRMYKEALAHAIIELFPTYKTKNSSIGGIDLFLNGQTGYLNSRLKNLQNKRRSEEGTSEASNGKKMKAVTYEDYPEENEIENEGNVEEDLLFLRKAVTPNQIEEIKCKLRLTLKRRIELTTNKPSVHLRSNFPFFFSDPSLISFDYKLRYSHFEQNLQQVVLAIEANVFQILKSLKIEYSAYEDSDWPHIIRCFLCLLKLLPPTATGRYSKTRQPSDQRASSFILFTRELISDSTSFDNTDPFIVAFGSNRASIQKYLIVVDGCVIDIPSEWTFVDVFDLFFKVHFVFNVDYNTNLRTFLRFFEKFAYNHNGTKITNRIQEISTQLFYQQSEIFAKNTK